MKLAPIPEGTGLTMRLRFWILPVYFLLPPIGRGEAHNHAGEILPAVLETWTSRVDANGGVHAWNREHDGLRVFQEWIALLTLEKNGTPEARRRVGLALERYVVKGNIRPLGFVGTSLPVPGYDQGDFDMSLLGCVSLLGLFQDDRLLLTDATYLHLIKKVVRTWGQTPKSNFDVFFVSVAETENHLFMTESTRFLTNQMIWENPRGLPAIAALRETLTHSGVVIDNSKGILRRLLLKVMHKAMSNGFFEFNAQIYQRFTIHALDNLYSFSADRKVADGAACLLDYLSAQFAFQSYGSFRFGPYRRSSEVYQDSALIFNDAACSFFAVQSGQLPWQPDPGRLWNIHTSHASMALFSAVLKYRIPDPILDFMQNRPAEYRAETRSAYAGSGNRKRATEVYYGSRNFLLTAGGRYESYAGPNFPTYRFWFHDAPWVYDVITRSSTLILDPSREHPRLTRDILHFRGSQWKANNLALYRNFIYGYVPVEEYGSVAWPHHVPAGWRVDNAVHATPDFDFRFIDRSDAGVYLVLGRLRQTQGFFRWKHQKYVRGTLEVVDTARIGSLAELREKVLARNAGRGTGLLGLHRLIYVDLDGNRIHLNPRYDDEHEGITRVVEQGDTLAPGIPALALPFAFPWLGESVSGRETPSLAGFGWGSGEGESGNGKPAVARPLFRVDLYSPWKGTAALSDGRGNMYVYNPSTGGYCLANFREWWNPMRKIRDSR